MKKLLLLILGVGLVQLANAQCGAVQAITQPIKNSVFCNNTDNQVILTFTASSGATTIRYQWFENGQSLPNEKSNSLTLNPMSEADNAYYYCVAGNSCGNTLQSDTAFITVNQAAHITRQPVSDSVCFHFFNGPDVTVESSIKVEGTKFFTRWQRREGNSWKDISNFMGGFKDTLKLVVPESYNPQGEVNSVYSLPNQYRVLVTDQCLNTNQNTSSFYSDTVMLMARTYPHAEGLRVNSEEGETFLIAKASEVFTSITNNYTIHWFKDGQLQTGHINSSSYLVEDDGQYELVVTNYGYCSDSTGTYMHNITGMQNTQSTAVSLYPNPVLNTLHLSQKLDWSILSDKGEVLLHGVGQEVEMGEITSGTYILQLNNNGAISNQSFVKQ